MYGHSSFSAEFEGSIFFSLKNTQLENLEKL